MNITPARKRILELLVRSGGTIYGGSLGGPGKSQATRMAPKLVRWEPCDDRSEDLNAWKLHITDAGRAALAAAS